MGWVKPEFTDGDPLYAAQLNHLGDGIEYAIGRFVLDKATGTLYITIDDDGGEPSLSASLVNKNTILNNDEGKNYADNL